MLRLRELRKEKGLTQQELARFLSITQATLSGWETEKYQIDTANLIKCARFFNVSVDYLLGSSDDKHRKILLDKIDDIIPNYEEEEFESTFKINLPNELSIENLLKLLDANSINYEISPTENNTFTIALNCHEAKVITAYRDKPEMQPAVDTLLGIADDDEYIPVAARNGKSGKVKVTSSLEERKAALDKELPGVSTPKKPDVF